MIAHLEAIRIIGTAPVGGAFHVTKLNFIDAFLGTDACCEANLQQAMAFLPVHLGIKIHPGTACLQRNLLHPQGAIQDAGNLHHGFPRRILKDLQGSFFRDGHALPVIHAVNIPGVKQPGHIFVHLQHIALAADALMPCLIPAIDDFTQMVQLHAQDAVIQGYPFFILLHRDREGRQILIHLRRPAAGGNMGNAIAFLRLHQRVPIP